MQKLEAKITPRVNKWCQSWLPESTPFDVKHTRGEKRFPLREIDVHQWDYMLAATTDHGFIFKIEDAGYRHPPCDTVFYKNATNAGFAIVFPDATYYIRSLDLETVVTPSITESEAEKLSIQSIRNLDLPK